MNEMNRDKTLCTRCQGPVGLGHQMFGICSLCMDTQKKVQIRQPNYFREVKKGGRAEIVFER